MVSHKRSRNNRHYLHALRVLWELWLKCRFRPEEPFIGEIQSLLWALGERGGDSSSLGDFWVLGLGCPKLDRPLEVSAGEVIAHPELRPAIHGFLFHTGGSEEATPCNSRPSRRPVRAEPGAHSRRLA